MMGDPFIDKERILYYGTDPNGAKIRAVMRRFFSFRDGGFHGIGVWVLSARGMVLVFA